MIPKIDTYGQYSNSNYGAHTLEVDLGPITLFYSYNTIVAFSTYADGLVCSENRWGKTTGKHLNWIQSDHKRRVAGPEFEKRLTEALEKYIRQDGGESHDKTSANRP